MREKLGVVIPAYNCEDYIAECIESILSQTYQNIEVVVVDDGSTDHTLFIAQKYECSSQNVHVISQKNSGPIKARYAGIKALQDCAYITFVDSDDWIAEKMYEDLMSFVERYEPDLVASGIYRYHAADYIIESHDTIEEGYIDFQKRDISVADCFGNRAGSTSLDASLCTKIFKKEKILRIYEKACDLDVHYGEDVAILYPYIMLCKSLYCTYTAYYYHRIKTGIASYAKGEDYFEKLLRLYDYLRGCFAEDMLHFPKLMEELDYFFMRGTEFRKTLYETGNRCDNQYLFPFGKVNKGENIVIYGMGKIGKSYIRQIHETDYCNIVAVIDKYSNETSYHTLEDIKGLSFDHFIIALAEEKVKRQIVQDMINEYKIAEEKIIQCHLVKL